MPTQQDDIQSRLAVIESIVTRLEYRLLGNGQPGELEQLDTRIDELDSKMDEIKALESKGRGALWVIGIVVGLLTSGGLVHIFKVGLR